MNINLKNKPTRKIIWKSSINKKNAIKLLQLQEEMAEFYQNANDYYDNIDYTSDTWNDITQLEAQDILSEAKKHEKILEVGCGRANILKSGKIDQKCYTGFDFSRKIIQENCKDYPKATFHCLKDVFRFPVGMEQYDFVFSHYVLEHCIFPSKFLDECIRVLKLNGTLVILCPDFLGVGRMSSQRAGFSAGPGRQKISIGMYSDAIITGFDNKIKIPLYSFYYRILANIRPRFYVNLHPTCFVDKFSADVDAVYLTYTEEIKKYLSSNIKWVALPQSLSMFSKRNAHIYLKGIKVNS